MKNICILIFISFILFVFVFGFSTPSSAQFVPYNPFFTSFNPFFPTAFNPAYAFPFVPPVPTYSYPLVNPVLSPFSVLPTLSYRAAAATVITLPAATPAVTAYAPLGTLNLTPSSLVFLILLLTLAE
ncbi:MAG: hypothetical protein ACMUIM_05465 [bacterium]